MPIVDPLRHYITLLLRAMCNSSVRKREITKTKCVLSYVTTMKTAKTSCEIEEFPETDMCVQSCVFYFNHAYFGIKRSVTTRLRHILLVYVCEIGGLLQNKTGRRRQVTTIKDAAFGLGYHPRKRPAMAAAMVDLVASKPRHAGLTQQRCVWQKQEVEVYIVRSPVS